MSHLPTHTWSVQEKTLLTPFLFSVHGKYKATTQSLTDATHTLPFLFREERKTRYIRTGVQDALVVTCIQSAKALQKFQFGREGDTFGTQIQSQSSPWEVSSVCVGGGGGMGFTSETQILYQKFQFRELNPWVLHETCQMGGGVVLLSEYKIGILTNNSTCIDAT